MDSRIFFFCLVVSMVAVARRRFTPTCNCREKTPLPIVNECDNPLLNDCHPNATCFKLGRLRFSCNCDFGFTGDGIDCEPNCDEPCPEVNQLCGEDQVCVCAPGTHLLNGSCVEECETYGTTFMEYPGRVIRCPNISSVDAANFTVCKDLCIADPNCLAYAASLMFMNCVLYFCDPLTPGALFRRLQTTSDFKSEIRNCA